MKLPPLTTEQLKRLQAVRRLHHQCSGPEAGDRVLVSASDVLALINAFWAKELEHDRAAAQETTAGLAPTSLPPSE